MKTEAPGAGKERATGQDLGCTLGRLFYLSLDHTAPDLHFSTGRRREGDWGLCSNWGGESEGLCEASVSWERWHLQGGPSGLTTEEVWCCSAAGWGLSHCILLDCPEKEGHRKNRAGGRLVLDFLKLRHLSLVASDSISECLFYHCSGPWLGGNVGSNTL